MSISTFIHPYSIHKSAKVSQRNLIKIGRNVSVQEYVVIRPGQGKVTIGDNVQINPFTLINGGTGVSIGKNVMIGPGCVIATGNHDYIQTKIPMRFAGNLSKRPIIIEDNVWIGANCTILDGVKIGKDAVIGANSTVTEDVEPFCIYAGNPARFIRNRLTEKKK